MTDGFFKLRSTSASAWPSLPRTQLSLVWAAYRELERTQWLDPEELARHVLVQVRALLHHAAAEVPYYRKLLGELGVSPDDVQTLADFRRIPTLARRTYQERFEEFLAERLPPGVLPTGSAFTSGSTGIPVEVRQTNMVLLWWLAIHLRDLEWSGVDPLGTLAAIRHLRPDETDDGMLEGRALPNWDRTLDALVETGPAFVMDIRQDPRRQLEWLRRVKPDYLVSGPSNLEFLAGLIEEEGRPPERLRVVKSFFESLGEDAERRIGRAFGAPVKNTYSCSEAGFVASPCPKGHGLHVHSESVLLEVLDADGRPCPPGQMGRVVLTTLQNFRTPLIRYEIMDEAAFAAERCPCGRGLPLLERPLGKQRPLFHLLDGRLKSSASIVSAMSRIGGMHQFRVVQRAVDRVSVALVPDRTFGLEHERRIRAMLLEFFEAPVNVEIDTMARLEVLAGGKSPCLICEVNGPSAASSHARE